MRTRGAKGGLEVDCRIGLKGITVTAMEDGKR